MKAPKFSYTRALGVDAAISALAAGSGTCKVMGGSQSLGPMLNLRLARPAGVVDVSSISSLRTVTISGNTIEIGAAVTHAEIEDGVHSALASHPMRKVAGGIAYRAIRTRGTVGGSLAHADPAADWVVTLTTLGARVIASSPRGKRSIDVDTLMLGAYTTVLESDELIEAVVVPTTTSSTHWGYHKVCRKPGEFAEASAAVYFDVSRDLSRIVLGAADGPPILLGALARSILDNGKKAAQPINLLGAVANALPDKDSLDRKMYVACLERALAQSEIFSNPKFAE